ncbi:hypothetical protein FD754_012164 [Muntiacus muntjak]|uniref:SAM-dependent MTase RsmB/NOP-type domain-containing protein n=1 Tax=Muntiacus muntjak TaxID=9888 RepID=A0A5N3VDB7_MUNMU|nr:hypothetical protein FD754_012164 [Muntiacus muntjak]
MFLFPKIMLKSITILSALGKQEAERRFETLLHNLSHPPSFTTVRVNTHLASVQHVKNLLFDELQKQFNGLNFPILQHPDLQDVLLIPVIGPRKDIKQQPCEVIVGAQCGNAVLRGAHVYVPGIVSASKFMKGGDDVSVYSDIKGKCKKGAKEFDGTKIFLGNGISELSRKEIFSGLPELNCLCPSTNMFIIFFTGEPPFLPESFDRILLDAPCSGMGQRPNMACTWTLKEVMSYQPLQRKLFSVAVELLRPGGVLVYSTCTVTLAENEEQVAWALKTFPSLQLQHQDPQVGGEGMLGAGLSPEQLKRLQRFDPSAVQSLDRDIGFLRDASIEDLVWLANKDCIGFFIAKFIKCKSTQEEDL